MSMCHTELVTFLINKYFSKLISILITYDSSSTSELNGIYLESVQSSFKNLTQQGQFVGINWIDTNVLAKQEDLGGLLLQNADIGIEGYITILPSLIEFLNARLFATENSVLRLKDKYYLFLSSEDENPEDVLSNEILKLYPHHLFVTTARNSSNLTLWTQKFVGSEDNLSPIHLNTYLGDGHFATNSELYPNKFLNMFGRILEVASVTYIPYVVSYSVPKGFGDVDNLDPDEPKRSVVYTGTEADIVLSFCQLRNCTIKVKPYGNDNWGGVYENGTSDGLIGSVYRHETEFGIGCYYNWFNDLFETSIAIAKSAVPILAPAPSLYPAFMTIILPFNKLIWSLIIVTIFVSAIVMHVIMFFNSYMEHRDESSTKFNFDHSSSFELTQFQMVAIFFQQSFSQSKLDRFAARFFLSTLLLAGITLENTYSGQLKSLLTIPAVTEPVDTIQKFAATDWKWASPSGAWIFSIAFSDIPHEKIMTEKFVEMTYDQLRDASYKGNYGIGLERLHGGIYSFGDYIKDGNLDQMIMTKDDLYYDYSRGFAIRGWPLMDTFNTHILWCLEHGLYNYWEKKHVYNFLDRKTQGIMFNLASGHLQKFPPIPLTVANISGPLYALAIGYGMALIVLISEIFSHRNNKFKMQSKSIISAYSKKIEING